MKKSSASAEWSGDLESGSGTITFGQNEPVNLDYSFESRFGKDRGNRPEELIAAAHAGCYSMALSHLLDEEGVTPTRVITAAEVSLDEDDDGFSITTILLHTSVLADELDLEDLEQFAETAKDNCPVSKALAGADISVEAVLMDSRGELGVSSA
jgi:osmotically inducible protein OsmC